jgi:energy-coupling factor transporter ATP-binding protein EcfA2
MANCLLGDDNVDREECRRRLGPAPWDELNEVLELAAFPYRFHLAQRLSVGEPVRLLLRHTMTNDQVPIADLSSGEATIIRLLLLTFAAKRASFGLKLFLLDEPDAHLHTSLIHSFLGVLGQLVHKYGCRIIMSTHRIETIALAPDNCLFVMNRQHPRIKRVDEKTRTIAMLTSNVVGIVLSGKRAVFVEDKDDADYYRAVLEVLTAADEWRSPLVPEFVPSSIWATKKKVPAGKDRVRNIVAALEGTASAEVVRGLIDRDQGNHPSGGVVVLDRYSMENYLLDPLCVYVFLLDCNLAPKVGCGEPIRLGEESSIRLLPDTELQAIADAVCDILEAKLHPEPSEEGRIRDVNVEYTSGRQIRVPRWLEKARGHDIMQALRGITPRADVEELAKAMIKVRLIPKSLRQVLIEAVGEVEER